jgi:protocatechuate 3,4-dioxygenase, alpha subunit
MMTDPEGTELTACSEQSPSQTIGPMYGFALYQSGMERTVADGPTAVSVAGRLYDGDGEPIAHPDALIEVWSANQLARSRTDAFGVWRVIVSKPKPAPGAGITREAPYLHVTVWARGLLKQAQTRLYFPDEPIANAADPVLGLVPEARRGTLVGRAVDGEIWFDIHLQGANETVFFDF